MAEEQNLGDQDAGKGAVEGDGRANTERGQSGNTSLAGQNPHRTESNFIKSNDTDFPEPGLSPEHSGQQNFTLDQHGRPHQDTGVAQRGSTLSGEERGAMNESTRKALGADSNREEQSNGGAGVKVGRSPERDQVDQDPGERQKENQNDKKDDPLAA
jgi:hypothetical protein